MRLINNRDVTELEAYNSLLTRGKQHFPTPCKFPNKLLYWFCIVLVHLRGMHASNGLRVCAVIMRIKSLSVYRYLLMERGLLQLVQKIPLNTTLCSG